MTTEDASATTRYSHPPPPAAAPSARRSRWVTAAGVMLLTAAGLSGLLGLIMVLLGVALGPALVDMMPPDPGMPAAEMDAMSGIFTGVMVGLGIIALIWAATHVAAGVGILGGRGWARITGIVLSLIGLLFASLALLTGLLSSGTTESMMQDPMFRDLYAGMSPEQAALESLLFTVSFTVPFIIGYLIVLVTLIRSGAFFDRTAKV